MRQPPTLVEIDWSWHWSNVDDEALRVLAEALRTNTHITSISLDHCSKVTDAGLNHLEEVLRISHCAVDTVRVLMEHDESTITKDKVASTFRTCLPKLLQRVTANDLADIKWGDLNLGIPDLKFGTTCPGADDSALEALADVLRTNTSIRVIDLTGNSDISTAGIATLETVIEQCNVEFVLLGGNSGNDPTTPTMMDLCQNNMATRLWREANRCLQQLLLATLYARAQDNAVPLVAAVLPLPFDVMEMVRDRLVSSYLHSFYVFIYLLIY